MRFEPHGPPRPFARCRCGRPKSTARSGIDVNAKRGGRTMGVGCAEEAFAALGAFPTLSAGLLGVLDGVGTDTAAARTGWRHGFTVGRSVGLCGVLSCHFDLWGFWPGAARRRLRMVRTEAGSLSTRSRLQAFE